MPLLLMEVPLERDEALVDRAARLLPGKEVAGNPEGQPLTRASGHRRQRRGFPKRNGPRAVLDSQQPPTRLDARIDSTVPVQSKAQRAEDGSQSVVGWRCARGSTVTLAEVG